MPETGFMWICGRATLNDSESSLGPLKRKDSDPTFDEPWQAQALAMADTLVQSGRIGRSDWAEALGAELRRAAAEGQDDTTESYYCAVIAALEGILQQAGTIKGDEVGERQAQWRRAYMNTPHGQPVELAAGLEEITE